MSDHVVPDAPTIERLLREGGWAHARITDDTWRGRFRGRSCTFPFMVRVVAEQGHLSFAIVPYVSSPSDERRCEALYGRLLQLNQVLLLAKFCIDDDLDVVLSVEWPTQHLDPSEFHDCLDVLAFYADEHFDEIRDLARE